MTRILGFGLLAAALQAQQFYPFAVDQDRAGGIVDFGHLNHPLGPEDRISVRKGHFFAVGPDLQPGTPDDRPVRFFGVNLVFGANFPSEADAPRIARRLRRLGVNIARLHHLDTQPDRNPANAGSVLTDGPYPTLNSIAIARLRTLPDALKTEGIYINLNLHVGYQFRPDVDGVPRLSRFPSQTKPLRLFHPVMVDKQYEFTSRLLDALQLHGDPVLAMVEISNETSLVYHWQASSLDTYLEGEYKEIFQRGWNDYLAASYVNTDAIRTAWGQGESDGPDVLPGTWRVEDSRTGASVQQQEGTARIDAPLLTRPVIVKQVGFAFEAGRTYTAEIEMRADLPAGVSRNLYWDVKQDVSPWRTAQGTTVQLTNEWQRLRMTVTPSFSLETTGRFAVSVENVGAPVYIRGWRFYAAGRRGLPAGEAIEDRNISIVQQTERATDARLNDYLTYLIGADRAYLNRMLRGVRESTDDLTPVAGTQVGYGGLPNYDSHRDLDYQDNHYYVDHYSFPNVSWDGRDWRFRDQSNLATGADAFIRMAAARQLGRPYTVSEFNQPWPNTYAAESSPTLAIFGAFQHWDGLMHFAYSHGRGWDDGVPNGFNLNGDWSKWVNFGQSAWLFRSGAVRASEATVRLPADAAARLRAGRERRNGSVHQFHTSAFGYDPYLSMIHAVGTDAEGGEVPDKARATPGQPYAADTGEWSYDRQGRLWTLHAPAAAGIFGFLPANGAKAGVVEVELGTSARGFVSFLATSADGEPIERTGRLLITNPGYMLRTQPGSDPKRPQQIVNYGTTRDWWTLEQEPQFTHKPSGNLNAGSGPVWMERVELYVTLRVLAEGVQVFPLDGAGNRLDPLSNVEPVERGFRIHLQADGATHTPWYEVVISR